MGTGCGFNHHAKKGKPRLTVMMDLDEEPIPLGNRLLYFIYSYGMYYRCLCLGEVFTLHH